MCKQNNFQIFLLFAIEMAVLSVFLQKKDLGPVGVKRPYLWHNLEVLYLHHYILIVYFLNFQMSSTDM